ncbi:unnamed protein product [Sympodiomycopsis kandeliae]
MSSTARRAPARTRSAASIKPTTEGSSAAASGTGISRLPKAKEVDGPTKNSTSTNARMATNTTLGTRKRAALGDLTNANRARSTATTTRAGGATTTKEGTASRVTKSAASTTAGSKVPRAESSTAAGKRIATRAGEEEGRATRVVRRAVPSNGAGTTTRSTASSATSSTVPSRSAGIATSTRTDAIAARRVKADKQAEEDVNGHGDADRENKRIKLDEHNANITNGVNHQQDTVEAGATEVDAEPKDAGWEDLDAEDADDPLMVAEYVNEIFAYMKEIEMTTMPNGSYMDTQNEIDWNMRGVLVDWLVDVHTKFRLLPETLFLALNIVDRFLTIRAITLNKLQLVGLTAMFIAAKYEEVLSPGVSNFLYSADGGYDTEEILKAERYMLKVLGFNMSYANPMNFLRRISKADSYDIQTRTVAKYFMEISLVDFRLLEHPPSLVAAASIWMARKVLERGPWTPTLVHYSSYTEYELLGTAEIMLDYVLRPVQHPAFHKKYSGKKFMRASPYVVGWAKKQYPAGVVTEAEAKYQDLSQLRVDLFAEEGLLRPSSDAGSSRGAQSRSVTPAS